MRKLSGERGTERAALLSEYGRQKLIGYADSFKEIAKTLEEDFEWDRTEETRQSCLYNRRLWENRCMLADNLNEMAGVMAQVAAEVFSYRPFPERKEKLVVQALRAEGITAKDLYYIDNTDGRVRVSLTMRTDAQRGFSAEETADMLSVLLEKRLVPSMNCPYMVDHCLRGYVFVEEAKYIVMTGAARAVKEMEPKSGDNYTVLESEKGKITLLLSDGMGSGEKACEDSEGVLDLMEKLIEAGYRRRRRQIWSTRRCLPGVRSRTCPHWISANWISTTASASSPRSGLPRPSSSGIIWWSRFPPERCRLASSRAWNVKVSGAG